MRRPTAGANYVRSQPGCGWFPYLRSFGAEPTFFNDEYKLSTGVEVDDISDITK
ncbi:hypothetical protein [Phaeobacter gallaeciensis]|uniref:hypothetical protein n=1 Tax=Phaeobacter gallaeciensis TaxID=60890 RepID=UPI00215DAEAD|nr:hypothetical protein [Phaeobacter gallaeciensis]